MTRSVFYSFHYEPDSVRASQVRNIGTVEGNRPANDNDWETIISQTDRAIETWISNQMIGKSCAVVLVGKNTANRKWINYEIVKAWNKGMGVVGIRIHGLKNFARETSTMGNNPFEYINFDNTGRRLSSVVKCYNPAGSNSQERYDWIKTNLANAVEEAIRIRSNN